MTAAPFGDGTYQPARLSPSLEVKLTERYRLPRFAAGTGARDVGREDRHPDSRLAGYRGQQRAERQLGLDILVADDHQLVRDGVKHVLNAECDLEVVAEAADGAEAVERALTNDVHLAILDISVPRMTGLQAARELSRRRPELRLVAYDPLTPRELESCN